jgi:predicted GIY-YIG superfamily endonuclease
MAVLVTAISWILATSARMTRTLYTGVTSDLARGVWEHRTGAG